MGAIHRAMRDRLSRLRNAPCTGVVSAATPGPLLRLSLVLAIISPLSASGAAAGNGATVTASAAPVLTLRGTVLPPKTKSSASIAAPVKVASLMPVAGVAGKGGLAKPAPPPRFAYSNFRFSTKPAPDKPSGVKMASLHPLISRLSRSRPSHNRPKRFKGVGKGLIKWLAYPGCVPQKLKGVLVKLSNRFGKIIVTSTHRSKRYNRHVGGAKHSYHLRCQAVDFNVARKFRRKALVFLRRQPEVGGLKHYGHGRFHIDTGPRRTW